jgi:hypothetical protein
MPRLLYLEVRVGSRLSEFVKAPLDQYKSKCSTASALLEGRAEQ